MKTVNQPFSNGKEPIRRHLLRSATLVAGLTLVSRVLGMIRDVVNANFFGTTWQWDAFLYAFMIPNFFRRIAAEGALASAFIPIYSEVLHREGKEAAFRYANTMNTLFFTGLSLFFILVEICCIAILRMNILPERLVLTVRLLEWLFPYLGFISLASLAMGVLNSHKHFFAPNLGPIILNVFWIAGVLWIIPGMHGGVDSKLHGLAWIILFAGFCQLAVELPPLWKLGFKIQWIFDVHHQMVKKTWQLLTPAIFSFAVVQVNLLVDMTLAFFIGPGAASSLWYGTRLMQLPLGVFAIAMGTALLPTITEQAVAGDREGQKQSLSFAFKTVFFIILPCSVGFIILSTPIVQLLFQRGEFDALSTVRTSSVLLCYSIGLFAYSGHKIMTTGFYAHQDTKTPVKIGVIALLSNIVFNLILMGPFQEAGLALATSLSGILQFVLLTHCYEKEILKFMDMPFLKSCLKLFLAALGMGVVCHFSYQWLASWFVLPGLGSQLAAVFGAILVSVAAYFFLCSVFRVREVEKIFQIIKSRKKS